MPSMQPSPDETQSLRRCVRDLVALSTLPAIWGNADPPGIGRGLAEVLLRVLSADFLYVRLHGRPGAPAAEAARTRRRAEPSRRAHEIGQALGPWLRHDNADPPPSVPNPVGDGVVRLAVLPIGFARDHGLLAAGCGRPDFPTETERLLLGVAANQAAGLLQRKETEEALREADRRKDEFLAMLAHELRNPLAPLRNALQVLKAAPPEPATAERARGTMERQVQHLARLVDDLLDVSRVMRGKIVLRKEPVELAGIVARAVETAQPVIDAQGHRLTIDLPPEPLPLEADPVRLAQVVGNLLTNAAKYTERGGRIWLTALREGGEAVLRVRDTGIGIAPDMLPKIFDLFMQVDHAAARSQGGLGIGLTLVKNLVALHRGTVRADSPGLGRGSEFVLRLPLTPVRRDEPVQGDGAPPPRTEPPARRRLLVVDDNRDAADTLAVLLELEGHEVRVVHDGPAALALAADYRPELALLDIGMPGMDGYELARRLRRLPGLAGLKLVALTGWGQQEDRRRSKEAGFDYHFVKPVDPAALELLLTELLPSPPA